MPALLANLFRIWKPRAGPESAARQCGEKEKSRTKHFERDLVSGWLYEPAPSGGDGIERGLVLTHGAGSNCNSPLLVGLAEAFAAAGFHVLRCNLPYRQ